MPPVAHSLPQRFISYATWPATAARFASYAAAPDATRAAASSSALLDEAPPLPPAAAPNAAATISEAASSPQQKKGKKKKRVGKDGVSFHPNTKRTTRAPRALAGGRRGRPKPVVIDLDVVGTTHRAYTDAKDAVRNRKKPQKPPEDLKNFDADKWSKEAEAFTSDLSNMYDKYKAKPKTTRDAKGAYVPKARKTQRAKQKPKRGQQSMLAL